jgi:hypothetical protein
MQTSTSSRTSGSTGASEELPPPNPYGPPPGIFNDILKKLGLKKDEKDGGSTATTGAATTGTGTTGTGATGTGTTGTGTTGTGTTDTGTGTTGSGTGTTGSGTGTTGSGTTGSGTTGSGTTGSGTESSGSGGTGTTTPPPSGGTPAPSGGTPASGPTPTFEDALQKAINDKNLEELHRLATDTPSRQKVFDAMMGANMAPSFLGWLNGYGNAATWAPDLDDPRYERFITAMSQGLVANQNSFNTVWTLYKDPAARTLNAANLTWSRLYTSRILPSGDTTVTWPGGTSASSDGATTYEWRSLYQPVGPNEATMKRLMVGVRPLPRGHVNIANIAFVNQSVNQWRQKTPTVTAWANFQKNGADDTTTLATSYYLDNCKTVVIVCDTAGGATNDFAIGATPGEQAGGVGGVSGGPALTWFMNHVRHEVGHAVGASALQGVSETGNAFATTYGGWAASSAAEIKAAPYWTASGTKKLKVGAAEADVTAQAAADWLAGLIEGGAEPAGNAVTTLTAGNVPAKIGAIEVAWSGQPLTNYVKAITNNGGNLSVKDSAYQFTGFTPPGPNVIIWASRFNPAGWTKYSKAAYDACVPKMGFYCVSSPVEMFAEMYTHKFSGGALPAAVNGKNPTSFFTELENSSDTQFQTTGAAAGEAAPMNPAVTVPSNTLPRD